MFCKYKTEIKTNLTIILIIIVLTDSTFKQVILVFGGSQFNEIQILYYISCYNFDAKFGFNFLPNNILIYNLILVMQS